MSQAAETCVAGHQGSFAFDSERHGKAVNVIQSVPCFDLGRQQRPLRRRIPLGLGEAAAPRRWRHVPGQSRSRAGFSHTLPRSLRLTWKSQPGPVALRSATVVLGCPALVLKERKQGTGVEDIRSHLPRLPSARCSFSQLASRRPFGQTASQAIDVILSYRLKHDAVKLILQEPDSRTSLDPVFAPKGGRHHKLPF